MSWYFRVWGGVGKAQYFKMGSVAFDFNSRLGGGRSTIKNKKAGDFVYYIESPDGYKPLKLSSNKMIPIHYKGSETFTLYSKTMGESEDSYQSVCKTTLPSDVDEMFLLLLQRGSSVRMFPMNVSPKVLPKGKLALVNISGKPLAISFGGKQLLLQRNANCILDTKASDSNQDLKIATRKDNKWRLIYSSSVQIPQDLRNIVLLYSSGKTGDISVDIINLKD